MHRRGTVQPGTRLASILIALLLSTFAVIGSMMPGTPTAAAASNADQAPVSRIIASPVVTSPGDDAPPAPPGTVSEFYPESANLSDCVGLVEKSGCGSGSRGGWRQQLVFVVLFVGLGVIFWRVARGINSNRRTIDADINHSGIGTESESDTRSDIETDTP